MPWLKPVPPTMMKPPGDRQYWSRNITYLPCDRGSHPPFTHDYSSAWESIWNNVVYWHMAEFASVTRYADISSSESNFLPPQSKKASIYEKQSIDFRIIIKRASYCSIGLLGNIIYGLFIIKRSNKYQIRNLSTQFWSFDLYVISWIVLTVNISINQTKLLFFLHPSHFYVKY